VGDARTPEPVKLIVGILAADTSLLDDARAQVALEFGALDLVSEAARWHESPYYVAEMGTEIWRQFVSVASCIDPGTLAAIKHRSNVLEARWRVATGRRVNLDPGYLTATKLVLASTKDAAHRVYFGDGIYAEATLQFAHGAWQPYAYTYRDYAADAARAFFSRVRECFLAQRRAGGRAPAGGAANPSVAAPTHRSRAAKPA
jgi:hypothetical protein